MNSLLLMFLLRIFAKQEKSISKAAFYIHPMKHFTEVYVLGWAEAIKVFCLKVFQLMILDKKMRL